MYVADANNSDEAHAIHKKIWNLGNAPFLMVLLQSRVHVYTGFDFDDDDKSVGLLDTIDLISNLFEDLDPSSATRLTPFNAESIDSGRIWRERSGAIDSSRRVDRRLLKNLSALEKGLIHRLNLSDEVSLPLVHSLIGKYIYIRYLRDRNILDDRWLKGQNLSISQVLGREATKEGLLLLSRAIEDYFKGDIFPLPANSISLISDEIVSTVASVFGGDDIETDQLHLDFKAYDFSFIPVETLSAIYEQFLKAKGTGEATGAVYTPEPLADYLLREVEFVKPLEKGMRVLDSSCGSGIFLVQAYRFLIEKELLAAGGKISRTRLRNILRESVFGVEKDLDACYVAELSLVLTMLDYIEPKELNQHKDFEFPTLHNQQIFHCDFFDKESLFAQRNLDFDWIIGNPPWTKIERDSPDQPHILEWIRENSDKPVAHFRAGEAFSWKVRDFCKPDGVIGLILHATSLTNHDSEKYRKAFFESNEVFRITNFCNLAYILFERRAEAPAYSIIYTLSEQRDSNQTIVHYAPLVANQAFIRSSFGQYPEKKKAWMITINEDEISRIESEASSLSNTLTWKLAMWGNQRDKRTLARLKRVFPISLSKLSEDMGWSLSRGVELKLADNEPDQLKKKTEEAPYLRGLPRFNPQHLIDQDARFQVSVDDLEPIPDELLNLRRRGGKKGLALIHAPHLVLGISYAAFSDLDFVVTNKPVGLAAPERDSDHLRALSVYLNSSVCRYSLFFLSASWGIDRNTLTLSDLLDVPVPKFTTRQIKALAQVHKTVAAWERDRVHSLDVIREYIDKKIGHVFQLPHYLKELVEDFVKIKLELAKGKVARKALRKPTHEEYRQYGLCLKFELDQFNHDSTVRHTVKLRHSDDLAICTVSLVGSDETQGVEVISQREFDQPFMRLRDRLRSEWNQWIYVQKGLRIYEMSRVHVCKGPRLVDWTPRQAVIDAGEIFSEVVMEKPYLNSQDSHRS